MRTRPSGLAGLLVLGLLASLGDAAPARTGIREQPGKVEWPERMDDSVIDLTMRGEPIHRDAMAVLDFEDHAGLTQITDVGMSKMLTTSLAQTRRFELVERARIDQIIREQRLGQTGVIDAATAAQMGQLIGARYIVLGAITSVAKQRTDRFGYIAVDVIVAVDVRAVESTTGTIVLSESAEGRHADKEIVSAEGTVVRAALEDEKAYTQAARDAVQQVSRKIAALSPVVGTVLDVGERGVTIDRGEDQGVATNDRFVVFRPGEEIVHPVTGERVGWKKELLQEIEIERTERAMSWGRIIKAERKVQSVPGDLVISR